MRECDYCGSAPDMPYQCNYCGGKYCVHHRLPEGHECNAVEFLSRSEAWFRTKETNTVVSSKREFEAPEPVDPDYTVGTIPTTDYESSPEVTVASDDGEKEAGERDSILSAIRRFFGW
ncbi:MAG: AN1-type zinc finger domain-containing protein [Salinirussus sp.]